MEIKQLRSLLDRYLLQLKGAECHLYVKWLQAFLAAKPRKDNDQVTFAEFSDFIQQQYRADSKKAFTPEYFSQSKSGFIFNAFQAATLQQKPEPIVQPTKQMEENEVARIDDVFDEACEDELEGNEIDEDDVDTDDEQLDALLDEELEAIKEQQEPSQTVTLNPLIIPKGLHPSQEASLRRMHGILAKQQPGYPDYLKPYQIKVLIEYCNALMVGKNRAVVPLATGSGKTIVMIATSDLIVCPETKFYEKSKILILVPRIKLIGQTITKFRKFTPHLKVIAVDSKTTGGQLEKPQIYIATLQAARKKHFFERTFFLNKDGNLKEYKLIDLILHLHIDEAHNTLGEQGINNVIELSKNKDISCLAFTATPELPPKKLGSNAINSCFTALGIKPGENPISKYSFLQGIKEGNLARVCTVIVTPKLDADVSKRLNKAAARGPNGDIQEQKVGYIINTEANNNMIVAIFANGSNPYTKERYLTKQAITFAAGINHAEDLAAAFRRHIKIDGNPYLEQQREQYVERVLKRKFDKLLQDKRQQNPRVTEADVRLQFNRKYTQEKIQKIRSQFSIAEAIHSGRYSLYVNKQQAEQTLASGKITYHDREHDTFITYDLSNKEREKLRASLAKNTKDKFKIPVKPALTSAQKEKIFKRYEEGGISNLVGADMLTEGFDPPKAKVVIKARPTKSPKVEEQCNGRVERVDPDNPDAIATIISINYGIPGQLFFPHIAQGAWKVGNFDTVQPVDHSFIPVIVIPTQTEVLNSQWESDGIIRITPLHSTSSTTSRQSRANPKTKKDRDILIDKLAHDFENSVTDIEQGIENFRKCLAQAKGVEYHLPHKASVKRIASSKEPEPSSQATTNYVSEGTITRAHEKQLQRVAQKAESLNLKIKAILEEIEAVGFNDDYKTPQSKRQKVDYESQGELRASRTHPVIQPSSDENETGKSLHQALTQLRSLQKKLTSISTGVYIAQPIDSSVATNAPVLDEADQYDLETLQTDLVEIQAELDRTGIWLKNTKVIAAIVDQSKKRQPEKLASGIDLSRVNAEPKQAEVAKAIDLTQDDEAMTAVPDNASLPKRTVQSSPLHKPPAILGEDQEMNTQENKVEEITKTSQQQPITLEPSSVLAANQDDSNLNALIGDLNEFLNTPEKSTCDSQPTNANQQVSKEDKTLLVNATQYFKIKKIIEKNPALIKLPLNSEGARAIHFAVKEGIVDVVRLLSQYQPSTNLKNLERHILVSKSIRMFNYRLSCNPNPLDDKRESMFFRNAAKEGNFAMLYHLLSPKYIQRKQPISHLVSSQDESKQSALSIVINTNPKNAKICTLLLLMKGTVIPTANFSLSANPFGINELSTFVNGFFSGDSHLAFKNSLTSPESFEYFKKMFITWCLNPTQKDSIFLLRRALLIPRVPIDLTNQNHLIHKILRTKPFDYMLKILLLSEYSADMNSTDEYGKTPLEYALLNDIQDTELAQLILMGCNPRLISKVVLNQTRLRAIVKNIIYPLDLDSQVTTPEERQEFVRAMTNNEQNKILEMIASNRFLVFCKHNGFTALQHAASRTDKNPNYQTNIEICKLLITGGTDFMHEFNVNAHTALVVPLEVGEAIFSFCYQSQEFKNLVDDLKQKTEILVAYDSWREAKLAARPLSLLSQIPLGFFGEPRAKTSETTFPEVGQSFDI